MGDRQSSGQGDKQSSGQCSKQSSGQCSKQSVGRAIGSAVGGIPLIIRRQIESIFMSILMGCC